MIIELLGPPGSGKTTIAEAFAPRVGGVLASIASHERFSYFLFFFSRHPFIFFRLLATTMVENLSSWELLRHKLSLLSYACAREGKALTIEKTRRVVVDEGLAQYLLVFPERELTSNEIQSYRASVLPRHVLGLVSAPADIRTQRMKKRGRIPRRSIPFDRIAWLSRMDTNSVHVATALRGDPYFTSITADGAPEAVTEALVTMVERV